MKKFSTNICNSLFFLLRRIAILFFISFLIININANSQNIPRITQEVLLQRLDLPKGKVKVVIDTDAYNEIDDQFALVYALLSPEQMKLEAVYAAPFLNNRSTSPADGMEKSHEEILRILKKLDKSPNNFVYRGSTGFLQSYKKPIESEAVKDLVNRAMLSDEPLYVLTLGAPTNVASAILMEPEIVNKIIVIWLGGKSPDWRTADEFNLSQDILASKLLFDSGVPLIQIPTEPVTSHLITTVPEMEKYLKGQGAVGNYLLQIFNEKGQDKYAWSKVLWDISVVAFVINPNWFNTEVNHSPILTDQLTYSFDNTRHFYRVVTYLNRNKIFEDMFSRIQQYHLKTSNK